MDTSTGAATSYPSYRIEPIANPEITHSMDSHRNGLNRTSHRYGGEDANVRGGARQTNYHPRAERQTNGKRPQRPSITPKLYYPSPTRTERPNQPTKVEKPVETMRALTIPRHSIKSPARSRSQKTPEPRPENYVSLAISRYIAKSTNAETARQIRRARESPSPNPGYYERFNDLLAKRQQRGDPPGKSGVPENLRARARRTM